MFRKVVQCGVFALMGMVGVMASYGVVISANADVQIKDVMRASFGKDGFKAKLTAAAKSKDFESAIKLAKNWIACAEHLAKNNPPKNPGKAWEERAAKFVSITRDVLKAAEAGDAKGITSAMAKINCKDCHSNHR